MRLRSLFLSLLFSVSAVGCSGGSGSVDANPPPQSSAKTLTAFSFAKPAATGTISESAKTIAVSLPFGTDVTHLVATFATTGAAVTVGAQAQASGATANDFTHPVVYTVTAADKSTASYTVTVTVATSTAKELTSFFFLSPVATGMIDKTALAVDVSVPFGTDPTKLVAGFTTTGVGVSVGGVAQVSGTTPNDFTQPVIYTVNAADGSSVAYTVTVTVAKNTAKAITAFALAGKSGSNDGVIDEGKKTIAVGFPFGSDVTGLVATFATTGSSVKVSGVEQVSGTTVNDFTQPLVYTVTAADGSSVDYTVTVTVALSSAKALTAFALASGTVKSTGTIDEVNKTIALNFPFGTSVTALVATFATTGVSVKVFGVEQVSGTTTNNFTLPVVYTVTAADGSSAGYTVKVTVAPSSAKAITAFSLAGSVGTIDEPNKAIAVSVPFATDVTTLIATFSTTGAAVAVGQTTQVSGKTANDFTNPVVYTVTAADGSSAAYTVTVTVAKNTAKAITAFSLATGAVTSVGTINEGNKTIVVNPPFGTDVTALVATFTTTGVAVKVGAVVEVSGTTANNFTQPVVYTVTAADGSSVSYTVTVTDGKNPAKAITSFSLAGNIGTIDEPDKAIAVSVPTGTDVTKLVATFTTTGTGVAVNKVQQASGTTVNNFTQPVIYTVSAADGSSVNYTVTVSVVKSTQKAITAFALALGYVKSAGVIDEANKAIAVSFPADIALTNLVATFTTTGVSVAIGSVVQVTGVGGHDFTNPIVYTVTAEDGSSVAYTVTVTNLPVVTPGPTQAPSFRIDAAHTAGQPGETLAPPLQPAWSFDAGEAVSYPLVANGRVFITTSSMVTALDTTTGAVVWGPNALGGGLLHAYDSGRLFVLTSSGLLMALDATSGVQLWSASLPGQLDFGSPPVAADGVVYVNGLESGGTTYAVDGATGNLLWTGGTFDGSDGAVAVGYGGVYESEACSQTTAWWAHDGSQLWHYSTGCTGGGGAVPALYRHRLYVRDWAEGNTILDITTGKSVGSFITTVPPAFSDGMGYFLQTGTLRGITTDTSTVKWSFAGDGALSSAPVVAGGYAYIGSTSGNLYALDGQGHQAWTTKLAAGINSQPETNSMAVAEGTLLVPAGNVLYAFVAQ